jgi:hypothetical protein
MSNELALKCLQLSADVAKYEKAAIYELERAEKALADLILLQSTHKTALLALEMLRQEVINERQAKEKAEADRAELLEALKQGVELFKYHEPDCFPSSGHCTEKCKQNKKTIILWRDLIARLTGETK